MAGVNGVSLGAVSIQELAVKRGGSSVSAGSTKSFEQFLNNGTSAQKQEAVSTKDSQASANTLDQPSASAKRDNLQAEDVKETDGMVQSVTEDGMPEDGKAEELLQEIRNIVKETLSVDDETVDGALEMMGISIMDLLDTATLQQFVLIVNGGQESTDFLTNEFLQQQGLTEEEAGKLLQEQPGTEATVHLQEAAAGETEGSKGQALPEMVEKVTISHSSGQQTEPVMAKENLSQDSSMENGFSEDASTLFSSERGAEEPQSQIVAPLFADQLNGLQDDMANIWKPEMNGAQRMQQMVDIVNQVSSQLRSSLSENVTKMEMQLNPESLGKVLFSVVSKAGVMTATFQVQSEEAKQALESQMLTLRETLEAKNLKVESVDVQISDFNFTQSNEAEAQNQRQNEAARQGRKRFRFDTEETDKMEGVEENNAETVRRQVMRDTGGSIDFTA